MDSPRDARTFEFQGFRLDAAHRRLIGPDGLPLELPSRAFDLLLYLVEHRGDPLDKATLLKAIWPTTVVEEGNLSQCIYALRRALGEQAGEQKFIATIPGRGYQFVAPVALTSPSPVGVVSAAHNPGTDQPAGIVESVAAREPNSWMWINGTLLGIVLTCAAVLAWLRFMPEEAPKQAAATTNRVAPRTIAVLPFNDLSSAKDMEYFADGIAEELVNSLAASGRIRVVGRRSTFAFKDKAMDSLQIGRMLNADAMLEGSVRTEGTRIQISARLVSVNDGSKVWERSFERAFDDVLDIQGTIAREVSAALEPATDATAGTRAAAARDAQQTRSPEAYRAFLRGIYYFSRDSNVDMPVARDEFLRATRLDPDFARAHAWLGRSCAWLARRSLGNIEENLAMSSTAIEHAMRLDPSLGEIWWMRTHGSDEDVGPFTVRSATFEQALAANPGDADIMLWLGLSYGLQGRHKESLELYERAHKADPGWGLGLWVDAYYLHRFGNNRPRVLELATEMENLSAADPRPHQLRAQIALAEGRALDWDRWTARAIEAAPRDQPVHGYLSLDYGHLGIMDAAMYHARICRDLNPESAASQYNESHILLYSGNIPAARAIVQQARREKGADFLTQLAQAELLYFSDDCAGSLESMLLARPAFGKPPATLNLIIDSNDIPIYLWCLRRQGRNARADEVMQVFNVQYAPALDAGADIGLLARLAAANGDRQNLQSLLDRLVESNSMSFTFVRHEPMILPYLGDAAIVARLDRLEARRAEWRKIVPKSSMRVPIPEAPKYEGG
jgi:TolB-like protein/DNA-binding winged helix-turn-helix (wHTH) protein